MARRWALQGAQSASADAAGAVHPVVQVQGEDDLLTDVRHYYSRISYSTSVFVCVNYQCNIVVVVHFHAHV